MGHQSGHGSGRVETPLSLAMLGEFPCRTRANGAWTWNLHAESSRNQVSDFRGVPILLSVQIGTSGVFLGPREVPHTCENIAHGGPSARRAEVRQAVGLARAVFAYV
jgi:hypothetical protein